MTMQMGCQLLHPPPPIDVPDLSLMVLDTVLSLF